MVGFWMESQLKTTTRTASQISSGGMLWNIATDSELPVSSMMFMGLSKEGLASETIEDLFRTF